jgi:type I restriction enzyme S subunit
MVSDFFVYYFLKANERDINENTTGTSIPHADKQRIANYLVVLPDEKTLQKFDGVASKMTYRIIANKNESTILSQIRGTLLPKLIAGRIRVPVEVR